MRSIRSLIRTFGVGMAIYENFKRSGDVQALRLCQVVYRFLFCTQQINLKAQHNQQSAEKSIPV